MDTYFVYLVECSDDTLYCGIAKDVEKRILMHNGTIKGGAKYTAMRRPVSLAYSALCENRSAAQKEEIRIKKLTREQKLQLIKT